MRPVEIKKGRSTIHEVDFIENFIENENTITEMD